jgi:hypothetical protein
LREKLIPRATIQLVDLPDYSPQDLNGAALNFIWLGFQGFERLQFDIDGPDDIREIAIQAV